MFGFCLSCKGYAFIDRHDIVRRACLQLIKEVAPNILHCCHCYQYHGLHLQTALSKLQQPTSAVEEYVAKVQFLMEVSWCICECPVLIATCIA